MGHFKKILVPTDFEAASKRAMEVAAILATQFESAVTLFHAYDLPVPPYIEGFAWPALDFAAAAQTAVDQALVAARKLYPGTDAVLMPGAAAFEILETIKKGSFDLVVMGTHGRRGFDRLLLGSVAERVLRQSPVPVLTVPGKAPA